MWERQTHTKKQKAREQKNETKRNYNNNNNQNNSITLKFAFTKVFTVRYIDYFQWTSIKCFSCRERPFFYRVVSRAWFVMIVVGNRFWEDLPENISIEIQYWNCCWWIVATRILLIKQKGRKKLAEKNEQKKIAYTKGYLPLK